VNGDSGTPQVIASQAPLSLRALTCRGAAISASPHHPEIASLLSLLAMTVVQRIQRGEVYKSWGYSAVSTNLAASPTNTSWGGCVVKGVQREIPLAGVWGWPPATFLPPLLEERGTGGEVNIRWTRLKCLPIYRLSTASKLPQRLGDTGG